ncbi:MAG: hypothetical protein FWG24_02195 [Eggerthellaceae bacterium]|nr:hypothetical protein [Eggerthellaceae bacterium]
MQKSEGHIIIPSGVNVWTHEYQTAQSLADAGYTVKFVPTSNIIGEKTHDVTLDGVRFEFKAPTSAKMAAVERNLKKAISQCDRIVFDSRRMKHVHDKSIERELSRQLYKSSAIKQIVFINRYGTVIDIKPAAL